MAAAAGLDGGLLVGRDDALTRVQRLTLDHPGVPVEHPGGGGGDVGVAGKLQQRCRHGPMASSSSQRRTVEVDPSAARPLVLASSPSSATLQRLIGTLPVAGSSPAIAVTSAMTAAATTGGRPGRGRSRRPADPWVQNRLGHLGTVLGVTRPAGRSARWQPRGSVQHDLARTTCREGAAWDRAARLSARRSLARNLIWNRLRPPPCATSPPPHRPR